MIKLTMSAAAALLLVAAPAFAQPGPPPAEPVPPPNYPAPPPNYPPPPPNYPPAPPPGYPTYQPGTYPAVGVVPQQMPGYQTHDGFYLNLALGPGYTSMSLASGGSDLMKLGGGGAGLSLALGGAVAPNFILFGHIVGDSASEPEVEVLGVKRGSASGSATVVGMGVGAAYYVMPVNVFLSGSALATQVTLSDSDGSEALESEFGFGLNLAAGKEWWVSDNWGLGASLQFLAASAKTKEATVTGQKATWTTISFALLLSATFN